MPLLSSYILLHHAKGLLEVCQSGHLSNPIIYIITSCSALKFYGTKQ